MSMQCRTVLFSGHVQGVGFRFNTYQIAKNFDITGRVRNLDDGRVELVAEGEAGEIETFLEAIRQRMSGNIHNEVQDTVTLVARSRSFEIGATGSLF